MGTTSRMGFSESEGSISAISNISKSEKSRSDSIRKLASSQRVAKPSDSVADMAILTRMDVNLSSYQKILESSAQISSTLNVADTAFSTIISILQRMNTLATQATNTLLTDSDLQKINNEFTELAKEIDRIAQSTEYNGKKLLHGDTRIVTDNFNYDSDSDPFDVPLRNILLSNQLGFGGGFDDILFDESAKTDAITFSYNATLRKLTITSTNTGNTDSVIITSDKIPHGSTEKVRFHNLGATIYLNSKFDKFSDIGLQFADITQVSNKNNTLINKTDKIDYLGGSFSFLPAQSLKPVEDAGKLVDTFANKYVLDVSTNLEFPEYVDLQTGYIMSYDSAKLNYMPKELAIQIKFKTLNIIDPATEPYTILKTTPNGVRSIFNGNINTSNTSTNAAVDFLDDILYKYSDIITITNYDDITQKVTYDGANEYTINPATDLLEYDNSGNVIGVYRYTSSGTHTSPHNMVLDIKDNNTVYNASDNNFIQSLTRVADGTFQDPDSNPYSLDENDTIHYIGINIAGEYGLYKKDIEYEKNLNGLLYKGIDDNFYSLDTISDPMHHEYIDENSKTIMSWDAENGQYSAKKIQIQIQIENLEPEKKTYPVQNASGELINFYNDTPLESTIFDPNIHYIDDAGFILKKSDSKRIEKEPRVKVNNVLQNIPEIINIDGNITDLTSFGLHLDGTYGNAQLVMNGKLGEFRSVEKYNITNLPFDSTLVPSDNVSDKRLEQGVHEITLERKRRIGDSEHYHTDKITVRLEIFKNSTISKSNALTPINDSKDVITFNSFKNTKILYREPMDHLQLDFRVGTSDMDCDTIKLRIESCSLETLGLSMDYSNPKNHGIDDDKAKQKISLEDRRSIEFTRKHLTSAIEKVLHMNSTIAITQNRLDKTVEVLTSSVQNSKISVAAVKDLNIPEEMVTLSGNEMMQQAAIESLVRDLSAKQKLLKLFQ